MIRISYVSDFGTLEMRGGNDSTRSSTASCTCRIIEASGFGFPGVSTKTAVYFGTAGQKTVRKSISSRTLTLSLEFADVEKFSAALRILSLNGELYIRKSAAEDARKIACYTAKVTEGVRYSCAMRAVVQLVCDYPYFTDAKDTKVGLMHRENQLSTTFTLPCVFSQRKSSGNVYYTGDTPCEPIITVTNGIGGTSEGQNGFCITNHAIGASLTINYYPEPGETVTINIAKRTITNNNGENLINYISSETELSSFVLCSGDNNIEVTGDTANPYLAVSCIYGGRYIEAVF